MKLDYRPKKDVTINCWIVRHDNLYPEKVVAIYDSKTMKWTYKSSSYGAKPYNPTFGNGNSSYWGDGPKYTTKKEAETESLKIRIKIMNEEIKKLKSKLFGFKEAKNHLEKKLEKILK